MVRTSFRPAARLAAAGFCFVVAAAAQSPYSVRLIANDPLRAESYDTATNTVVANQTLPAGALTRATLETFAQSYTLARYTCSTTATAAGVAFDATSMCWFQVGSLRGRTHADLTLTIGGTGVARIEAELWHGGDGAIAPALAVDLGDDGTNELEASCITFCASPWHHRLWTWDFADGPLVIRIRTDQWSSGGPQIHGLELDIVPWAAGATPVLDACPVRSEVISQWSIAGESVNYQLAAESPASAQEQLALRAFGHGDFGFYVVSGAAATRPLVLSNPAIRCNALADVILVEPGIATATMLIGASPSPRAWRLAVPRLPPGLRFFVQHGSLRASAPAAFGTTNVVRVDT
ncbi:MAG: hypothetical protein KDE27_33045 [Planctomycetes bacterium]|nr:hypothetical protein [Planctomycetota bacterium]